MAKPSDTRRKLTNELITEASGELEWYLSSAPGDGFHPSFAEVEVAIEALKFVLLLRQTMGVADG